MPHFVLHLTPELQDHNWQPFFAKGHELISKHANIQQCKSRVNVVSQAYFGMGEPHQALVYLEVSVKPRPPEVIQAIGDTLFAYLKEYALPILAAKKLTGAPTVEVRLLPHYWQD